MMIDTHCIDSKPLQPPGLLSLVALSVVGQKENVKLGTKIQSTYILGCFAFPLMVSGSFIPVASAATITVIPSFSSFSIRQNTALLSVIAPVQSPADTDYQDASSIL
jgi:hypothetical protein